MEPAGSHRNKNPEGYRGALIYTQEEGYKMVSMHVHLYEGERSRVMSHAYEVPLVHEAERLRAHPPLAGIDVYSFPAPDNATNILLTIESQEQRHSAVYSVGEEGITELSPHLWLDIMEEGKTLDQQPHTPYSWEVAVDEAIDYYKDQIPVWLAEINQADTTVREPFHDVGHSFDFDR
jgi:hypothetical protein